MTSLKIGDKISYFDVEKGISYLENEGIKEHDGIHIKDSVFKWGYITEITKCFYRDDYEYNKFKFKCENCKGIVYIDNKRYGCPMYEDYCLIVNVETFDFGITDEDFII